MSAPSGAMDVPAPPRPGLHLSVLGALQVFVGGAEVEVPVGNQRRLLAALAVGRGRPIPAHRLLDDVWGEDLPADPRGSLHTNIARLRRTLGAAADCLALHQAGYALAAATRDDEKARAFITEADQSQGHARLEVLRRALGLWRGDAWVEFADDIAVAEARSMAELRARAVQLSAWSLIDLGQPADAVDLLWPVVQSDLLRENDVLPLVRALDACGRIGEAVDLFEEYRRELADRLGLDPSPALRQEQRRLLDRADSPPAPRISRVRPAEPGLADSALLGQLVGRDDLVAQICDLLSPRRVVTLLGPGGVGKTALARYVSERWEPTCWVDLSAISEESAISPTVLTALGGANTLRTPTTHSVVARLAAWSGLLVLDNCEHLIQSVVDLAEHILAEVEHVRILATSRERLDVLAESVVQVPPLSGPSAQELFWRRARPLAPALAEDSASRELVGEIVAQVDGLPLAVELAAARVGSLTLPDLAQRLARGLELLSGTGRRRPARHHTMRATMRWSYDLLEPLQQQVFRSLSCFAGTFELDSAEQVLRRIGIAPSSVSLAVADLAGRSLVAIPNSPGANRYRLLHVVRQFATDQLELPERAAIEQAHGDWVAEIAAGAAEGVQGPDEARWSARIQDLLPDLRRVVARGGAAAEEVAALLSRWAYLAMSREVASWAEDLLARTANPTVHLLTAAASSAWQRGDMSASREHAHRALSVHREAVPADRPDSRRVRRSRAIAYDLLGDNDLMSGDLATAQEFYGQSSAGASELGLLADEAVAWCGLATAQTFAGEDGRAAADTSLALARRSRNPSALGMAHYAAGEALTAANVDEELEHFRMAQAVVTGPRPGLSHSVARTAAAAILARQGPTTPATFLELAAMLDEWVQHGDSQFLVTALRNVIPLLVRAGAQTQALALESVVDPAQRASYGLEAEHLTAALDVARASRDTTASRTEPARGGIPARDGLAQWFDRPEAAREVLAAARATVGTLRELSRATR